MILTVGSIKGGVGKSTLASNLAVAFSGAGASVLLIDGDKQGSSALFAEARVERLGEAGYACVRARDLEVRNQVRAMRDKFDHVLVDVGGQDNPALRAALTASDRVLIPVPPRSLDAWTLDTMLELVREAQVINPDLKAFAVMNLAFPRGQDNSEILAFLREHEDLFVAPTAIVQRKAWSDAAGMGMSVLDAPRNPKASAELEALIEFLGVGVKEGV